MATEPALQAGETEEPNPNSAGLNPGETEEPAQSLNPGETEEANPNHGGNETPSASLSDMLLAQGKQVLSQVGQVAGQVGEAGADVAAGTIKGAADTVSTLEGAASHFLPDSMGGNFLKNQSQMESEFADTHGNKAQQLGKGVESIGEFFLGDEALKGLSFAEKAGVLKQIADLSEKHPAIAALIKRGLRTGAVTGAETLAKGGTPTQAAEAGAAGAVLGSVTDLGLQGASKLTNLAKDAFTTRLIQPAVKSSLDKFLAGVEKAGNFVEPEAEETGALGGAAEAPQPATSYRKKISELGQKFIDRGNAMFSKLDEATGKHWQAYAQNLQDAEQSLNEHLSDASSETNVAQEHKLVRDIEIAKENMARADALVRDKGISQEMIDRAHADVRQGNALKDLQKSITGPGKISGINPDSTVSATEKSKSPEMISPKALHDAVDNLAHKTSKYGSESRLLQAAGGDEKLADQLTADTVLNNLKHSKILAKQAIAKKIAVAAPLAIGLGYGVSKSAGIATHVFDGTKVVPVP